MNAKNHSSPRGLAHQEIVELADDTADALVCLSGTLWVTAHGSADDIVLQAGQRLPLHGMTRVVVQALGGARYRLARPEGRRSLAASLARWLRLRYDAWLAEHPAMR